VAAAAVLLALGLAGCGPTMSSALVSPGKYEFYPCQTLDKQINERRARVAELERLMARSAEGFGGEIVNAMAYRSDYLQNRGELDELIKTAEEKKCVAESPRSSQRAVF
jgi:hypothetical protein